MGKTLGLDIGSNSIGWALINDDYDTSTKSQIIDIGVRVFPEGVDAFDTAKEKSRNEDRRIKRGMRRQTKRRARRRKIVAQALVQRGLWPQDNASKSAELNKCPYELRARALTEKLTLYEIGRIFLHLNQRRGFLSNRKKDRNQSEVKGLLAEINRNEQEQLDGGFATLGAMLATKAKLLNHKNRCENDHVRNRHLSRKQYIEEFDAIWEAQKKHYPELFTAENKYGKLGPFKKQKRIDDNSSIEVVNYDPRSTIRKDDPRRHGLSDHESFGIFGLLFFQRHMYWPKSVIGLCELEPKEKRCPKSERHAERFRILQEVNNLRYIDPDSGKEHKLDGDQRKILTAALERTDEITFDKIRTKLNFIDSVKFTIERGKRKHLNGMETDYKIAKVTGKNWHERPEQEKDAIVRLLINNENDDDATIAELTDKFDMSLKQAQEAVGIDFSPGYMSLSLKAIDRLLPHLERGLVYQSVSDPEQSALHAAGYFRRDELQRRLFDKLPDFTRVKPTDCKLGDIPNPVVKRALVELRKLINAIIRKHGIPDAVHVEMARKMSPKPKKGTKAYKRYQQEIDEMAERREKRELAKKAIEGQGVAVRHDAILRYLFWQEQSKDCPYCGKSIGITQLFTDLIDTDHILPYSQCLDDSQMNKVVCHRECNHDKGQQTPYEWLAASRPKDFERLRLWAAVQLRKGLLPYSKYRKFSQEKLDLDSFIARQLNDTRYINRAAVEYLQLLFDKPHNVLGLKGQLTAELRWQWGLETILSELPDSPAWHEKNELHDGEKNRADHRHHAIDALVVALTNRKRLHKLSTLIRKGGAKKHGEILPEPWANFRNTVVERTKRIIVSQRVNRKVGGGLHNEKPVGSDKTSDSKWVKRKLVSDLSASEVLAIRDNSIRNTIINHLRNHGIEILKSIPKKGRPKIQFNSLSTGKPAKDIEIDQALVNIQMQSGVPIKKVRILFESKAVRKIRLKKSEKLNDLTCIAFAEPSELHHVAIFQLDNKGSKKNIATDYVYHIDALNRLLSGKKIVQRTHHEFPNAKFMFSLSKDDIILVRIDGAEKLMSVSGLVSTQTRIHLVDIYDARRDKKDIGLSPSSLINNYHARKVMVDYLGEIRRAND